jgi:hypothetical protein
MNKGEDPVEEFHKLHESFKESWSKYSINKGFKLNLKQASKFFMDFNWIKSSYKKTLQDINKYMMQLELL